jgi:hypothetical protein
VALRSELSSASSLYPDLVSGYWAVIVLETRFSLSVPVTVVTAYAVCPMFQ